MNTPTPVDWDSPNLAFRRFAVAAERQGALHLVDHFSTSDRANLALAEHTDRAPLFVVPARVWLSSNGNVRMWKSVQSFVHT